MQWPVRMGGAVAQQIQDASILEGWRTAAMLLQGRAAERVQEDFQGGVGADLMQGLALVLEDFLAGHVLGIQYAALGRAVHVFHQVALQGPGQ